MKMVCIMGRSSSGKSVVEKTLEQMGFKRSISYTTRKPRINNGVEEQDGVEYKFVSRNTFMKLVDTGKIIEYEEYMGNLYGTPRPYGAKRYVAVVCVNGYKALKEMYGEQVLGVYLKCNEDIALSRANDRDGSGNLVKERKETDNSLINEMENTADVVINSNQDINSMIADILKVLRDRKI